MYNKRQADARERALFYPVQALKKPKGELATDYTDLGSEFVAGLQYVMRPRFTSSLRLGPRTNSEA